MARVLWLYCMRLASSGVGGVRRVRLASLYVGSCVGVLWMFWMRPASSRVGGGCIGCRPKVSRTRRTPPTPDDASRMQYSHKTCATSFGPGPIVSVHARLGRHAFGTYVRWLTSGAPLGSQSLSGVAAKRPAGWSPGAGGGADSGRADGAGTGAGAAARRTRKDRQLDLLDDNHVHIVLGLHAPGVGVGGDIVLRAPLLLQVAEPAPRLFPLDLLLEIRALQLEPHAHLELQAQLVFLVCTQIVFLELPGFELGGAPGDEPGGACGDERLALLDNVKLKLRGGGGLLAAPPLHHSPVAGYRRPQ